MVCKKQMDNLVRCWRIPTSKNNRVSLKKIYLDDVLLTTTRDLTSVADAIDVLNTSPDVGHLLVVSDDSTSSANPATAAATAMSGGSDGSAVNDAARVTGLSLFGENLKSGAVCIPGANGSTIWNGLRDHAEAYNRIALCGFASGDAARYET